MNDFTRRTLLAGVSVAAVTAAARGAKPSWRPKLGILGEYTPGNLAFAKAEGFTSMGIWAHPGGEMNAEKISDRTLQSMRAAFQESGVYLSVVGSTVNHIAPDPDARKRINANFAKVIEMAGKLGVPYVGTASGTMPGRPLKEQVAEIVRVYERDYFPACEKYKVRVLWEPWPDGPNVATGPQGYDALFAAFGNSPYVGLQYDPSHLVRLFMDPIQTARDFADRIYDVHLKDTEINWPVLRKVGIRPFDNADWWRYRIPGNGLIDWPAFFTVLEERGYTGAMNIEHEDDLYGAMPPGGEFTEDYKNGFRVGHRYLRNYVPA
jgi:sugar phosphate isomerase/epimerase